MIYDARDIDGILKDWPFDQERLGTRLVRATDGRDVLQMRIEMGIVQMEVEGRPDGLRPGGEPTYLDYLRLLEAESEEPLLLDESHCLEIDREFALYYHRRVCWLALRQHHRALDDAEHAIALMQFVETHAHPSDLMMSYRRSRPRLLLDRTQAAAMTAVDQDNPRAAIREIHEGLDRIRGLIAGGETADPYESEQCVSELLELKNWVYSKYGIARSLRDQLLDAIVTEQFELAARLRDQIEAKRRA